jgi:tRNA threonylcarbamoyladenosine biosynthesis protein TsaE
VGEALAELLPAEAVVALRGDLASGKTCLVRGMAARFVPRQDVTSPTFTLVNVYGREPSLYHLDLYRLSHPAELAELGYEELFEPDGLTVVEWAERAEGLLPATRLDIALEHAGGDTRRLTFTDRGLLGAKGWERLAERLRAGRA